jgi:hypothetical protein
MERFIIQFNPDADGAPNTYWDGTNETSDLNAASLYSSLVSARQAGGPLQAQFTDREVTVKKVTVTIALAPATITVAT